ncbi:MAG: hypothetical protein IAF02_28980, partial [Anaerolineae bacterium]|nr:hypothetical protein [Anaerolineae bacterium]
LQDARPLIEQRHDSKEQIQWRQLSGRVYLQQGNLKAAHLEFLQALEDTRQSQVDMFVEVLLDFATLYNSQEDTENAARLLGYVQAQNQLPAPSVHFLVEPLHQALATKLDEVSLAALLHDGAQLNQQAIITQLLATIE